MYPPNVFLNLSPFRNSSLVEVELELDDTANIVSFLVSLLLHAALNLQFCRYQMYKKRNKASLHPKPMDLSSNTIAYITFTGTPSTDTLLSRLPGHNRPRSLPRPQVSLPLGTPRARPTPPHPVHHA